MMAGAVLNQYTTKLLLVLNSLDKVQSEQLRSSVSRVREYYEQVGRAYSRQAGTTLAFAVVTSACGFGASFARDPAAQRAFEMAAKTFPQFSQVVQTFQEGSKSMVQAELRLLQDHQLTHEREDRSKLGECRGQMEGAITKMQDAESREFHRL
jgi:hypothetical protein